MLPQIYSIDKYVNYFRYLAASCVHIAHDIASESLDAPDKSRRRFAIFEEDEVVGGLRSSIGDGVVLLLHPYFTKPQSNGAGDYRTNHDAAFIIADKPANDNINTKVASLRKTEEIAYLLLNQIVNDANEGGPTCPASSPFTGIDYNDFKLEPLMNIFEGRVGWYVQFTFQLKQSKYYFNPAIHNEPTTWLTVGDPQVYPNTTP
jgi:hypothetical protein